MNEVVAVVEGQTELAFVTDPLAAHLAPLNVNIWAVLSGKAGKRGGVRKWESARNDILRNLKAGRTCTTMFDFYGMPSDWPGRIEAARLDWSQRSLHVEQSLSAEIARALGPGFNPARFIPYVQLHEFEALLFANPDELASTLAAVATGSQADYLLKLTSILDQAGSPEAIDDGYETCPSRRITSLAAGFAKTVHGLIVARRIGLDSMRASCGHFGSWLNRLEAVGAPKPA